MYSDTVDPIEGGFETTTDITVQPSQGGLEAQVGITGPAGAELAARAESVEGSCKSRKTGSSLFSSRASNHSSQWRIQEEANAAALKAELEAQIEEDEREEELSKLELDETKQRILEEAEQQTRRAEAENKLVKKRRELERQKAATRLKIQQARLEVMEDQNADKSVIKSEAKSQAEKEGRKKDSLSGQTTSELCHEPVLNVDAPVFCPRLEPQPGGSPPSSVSGKAANESLVAQALADAIDKNRLPVPTPKVFSGNPMEFIGFKRSFKTLIENKGVSAEEKIYYLQQYVAGDARDAIAGCFYGTNESDYQHAWETLERRFGHPFKIQEAFREKLDKWPKIANRDGLALQKYADFLQTCMDAMPHISDLKILNDCKENQRMAAKLPDWAITRWSRVVANSLDASSEYPAFKQFVAFVSKEARAACHPVSSIHAVKGLGPTSNSKPSAEGKGTSARSLATDQATTSAKELKSGESTQKRNKLCPFCKGSHYLPDCKEFMQQAIENRIGFIQQEKRCFGCLRTGHVTKNCRLRHTCQKCKGRHPTALHDDNRKREPSREVSQQSQPGDGTVHRAASLNADNGHSSTTHVVPVWLSTATNPEAEILVYALLDTQSDSTFMEEVICEKLSAQSEPVNLKLSTLLGKDVTVACNRVSGLRVRGYTSTKHIDLPLTYTQELIPLNREHIPTCETAKRWSHLSHIASEMPPLLSCNVGLLIGYNCSAALAPRLTIVGDEDQPFAVKTDLGWSIVGSLAPVDPAKMSGICHRVCVKEHPPATPRDVISVLETDFRDTNAGDATASQDDIQFLQLLETGIVMNSKGHLEMPLPFKSRPQLPNNRQLAARRLSYLKGRLDSNPSFMEQYSQFIAEMLERGHAEPATEAPKPGEVYYIPHHGVYHPKKPDKLRVVFDCSAMYLGSSLNDHLLSGPDLTNNLFGVLCRFRRHPIAVMCDVEKMFHQFHVSVQDRDYLRFLWWQGGDTTTEPREYRMNVHLFGAKSSPACANFGLKHLANMFEHEYPSASPFLHQDYYVDDGITSLPSVEEAVKLIEESRELCSRGKLRLHKFVSNSREVLEKIPLGERAAEVQKVDLNKDELPVVSNCLGLQWYVESDSFVFQALTKQQPNSRRGILSTVAGLYDPVGFISPFVLEGKAVLQEMCRRGVSWDEPVSDELLPRWESWKADLSNLGMIQIPRCQKPADFNSVTRTELHHFSDASMSGYGTCSYVRFVSGQRIHCCLVASKARVSPVRSVTIPRLELTAAVVAVRLSQKLKQELQMRIDDEFFWCDSQIALGYISNDAKRFHVFVANRVQFIRDHTRIDQWHYVSTQENPADHASRGCSVAKLLASNWFTGPEFLWNSVVLKPASVEPSLMIGDPEVKNIQALATKSTEDCSIVSRLERFSTWSRAVRALTVLRRSIHRKKERKIEDGLMERADTELAIIKLVQRQTFPEDIDSLARDRPARTSGLQKLDPLLDSQGMLRVGGRLQESSLPYSVKHPLILPRKHHVVNLIIQHHHEQVAHQGRGMTMNKLRESGYWIVGFSAAVSSIVHKCVECRRLRGKSQDQKMANLPEERLECSPPFTYCGVDCFGPFYVKEGRKELKRYGLLLTCLASRAVHIEVIDDMSTDAFLNGLRCFIAIRGRIRQIRCDQGSNFVGAKHELHSALKEIDTERISATMLEQLSCDFRMNPPSASHMGGIWERQIRTIRSVLSGILVKSSRQLDSSSLRTLMYEVMAIINSRPLTVDNLNEAGVPLPLTPNHLLTMKTSVIMPPPGEFPKEDLYLKKRWRRVQHLANLFWTKWKREYLHSLQVRQKWQTKKPNIKVGDIVILNEEDKPRSNWRLARVVETLSNNDDGLVRQVRVLVGDPHLSDKGERVTKPAFLIRPVHKLVLLVD